MKENTKFALTVLLIMVLWICLLPIVVFAESVGTYAVVPNNTLTLLYSIPNNPREVNLYSATEVRAIAYSYINVYGRRFTNFSVISESPISFTVVPNGMGPATQYNGYYIGSFGDTADPSGVTFNIPFHDFRDKGGINTNTLYDLVIDYTFGEHSIEPVEPTDWGELRDLSYSTSVAGNNDAAMANKDIIKWGYPYDTNNNVIEDCSVEIRVIRGSYTGTDKSNLFSKKAVDFVLDNSNMAVLGSYPASQRTVQYSWSHICESLSIANFWKISAYFDNDVWIKEGWIYQARLLNTEDEYIGNWQTLYTATSASSEGSEMIITNNNYDVNVYQALQEITVVNNNTSIVFTYQDTDINITNPDDGTEPSGGTNLWDVLKQLITGVFQIIAKLGDIVKGLLDGLFELLRSLIMPPDEIDETVNQTFELNINNYVENEQNDLHQLNLALRQFELDLKLLANNYASGSGSCVITWEDVTIDLSAFNAGNVTFIQGGSYDFGTLFTDLIEGFGFTYSQYQFFVSGVIYICLIVFINNRIVGFLRRS